MTSTMMVAALFGLLLGAGALLVASPVLWPSAVRRDTDGPALIRDRLAQAGLARVSPATVGVVCMALGIAAAATVNALLGVAALAVAAGLVAAAIPVLAVSSRARARRRATRAVWPDVVDQLVSAVRSGVPLPDAVTALASVGPEATRAAFAEFERF